MAARVDGRDAHNCLYRMSVIATSLRTARLVLEPIGVARAARLLSGDLSELQCGPGWPHDDTFAALGMAALASADVNAGWFILRDAEVIGEIGPKCDLRNIDDEAAKIDVEIGYGLGEGARGHGYGSEAARAVVDWLLGWPAVLAVTADVEVGNKASANLLALIGFVLDSPVSPDPASSLGSVWQHWRLPVAKS